MADKTMDAYEERDAELDEELAEVPIAISVISKRLAKKITAKNMTKEHSGNMSRGDLKKI